MSGEDQTVPISADSVKDIKAGIPNGHVNVSSNDDPSKNPAPSSTNGNTVEENRQDLLNPADIKKTSPIFTINEDEDNDDGGVVKSKPSGHCRKGSSISQLSVASSSCSISRENSFISANADSISLPLTLEQLKNDTSARTTSDPALRLTADLSRNDLSDEQRHETLTKLLEEVVALKLEIVNLKEENEVLRRARTEMDDELHTLTENLFEEAYKMVDEAKGGKANAEKRLLDAAGQIEAMETKVSALNNLLHTKSTPSSSPSVSVKHKRASVKKMIKKIRKPKKVSEQKESEPVFKEGEFVTEDFMSFKEWVDKGLPLDPVDAGDNAFLKNVYLLQIEPCLKFKNGQLSKKVRGCVENNTIIIEPLAGSSIDKEAFKVPCALTNESGQPCSYRIKLGDEDTWYYISGSARNKIVSVCDFYVLVSYIQKGIVKKETIDLFWQLARLRAAMSLAVLNLSCQDPVS